MFLNCGHKNPIIKNENEHKETVKIKSEVVWTKTNANFEKPVEKFVAVDDYLFASTYDKGVFVSKDGGENWSSVIGLPQGVILAVSADDKGILYAGTGMGIYCSKNKGADWTEINNNLPPNAFNNINTIFNYQKTVFLGTSAGLFTSIDEGKNWIDCSNGISSEGDDGFFDLAKDIKQIITDGKTFFIATGNGVYSSTDGNNWFHKANGMKDKFDRQVKSINTVAISGNTVMAGTEDHLFYSTNKGDKWQILETGIEIPSDVDSDQMIDIKFFQYLYVYNNNILGIFNGALYVSKDQGKTWETWDNGIENENIFCVFVNEKKIIIGTVKGTVWMADVAALK